MGFRSEANQVMAITQKQVRQFLLIGGGIFALTMAFGSGMRARSRELKQTYELYKVYRQEARVAQLAVQGGEAQIHQLEARRLLDVAQNDLTRGDTNAAEATIAELVTRLETAQEANAATTADLTGLIADIKNLSLSDKTSARLSLSGFATAMDAKLSQLGARLAPDELSTVKIAPPTDNEKPTLGNDLTLRVK
ncbi:MAG: hypothetical protein H7145_23890 [Akkermansiaceae bacterium]|nr:hypothetical protein [Armatimonadota bacterium]